MLILSLSIAVVVFGLTIWRPKIGLATVVLLWPAYLLRTEIAGVPTTALEVSIFAVAGAVLVSLWRKRLPWYWVRMTKTTWWLIGAWVVAWIIATGLADDRQAALGALKAWLIDPLLFVSLLIIVIRSAADRKLILSAAILSALHVAVAGLAQMVWWRETLQEGRLSSYFAPVANYAAMYLGPLVVLQLGLLLHRERSGKIWWGIFGVCLVALLATLSFAAYLALAISVICIWYYLPTGRVKKFILIGGALGGVLAITIIFQTPNFRQHFDFGGRSSGSVRQQIWVTSWALVKEDPFFGVGPNNFETAYRNELPKHYFPPLEWLVAQPHNLVLALWLQTGLLGLLTFYWLIFYYSRNVWRKMRAHDNAYAIIVASASALVGILVHGLFDTPYLKNDLAALFGFVLVLPWLGQLMNNEVKK